MEEIELSGLLGCISDPPTILENTEWINPKVKLSRPEYVALLMVGDIYINSSVCSGESKNIFSGCFMIS